MLEPPLPNSFYIQDYWVFSLVSLCTPFHFISGGLLSLADWSLKHRVADASNLRLKRAIYHFCGSWFPKKPRRNFSKNSKLENPQKLLVKQGKIPIVPVLQVGKLRHRPSLQPITHNLNLPMI